MSSYFLWKPRSCQDTTDGLAVKHISDFTPQPFQFIRHYIGKVSWQHLTLCPDVCIEFVGTHSNSKAYVGSELTSQRKPDSSLACYPMTGKNIYFHMFPRVILTPLWLADEFWPSQLTSAYIRGWTAGWSDAQFLRTTVEELYLSDWANVSYLAGLPPRFPYRMSPDGLPHLTRDESGLPVSDIFLLSAFSWLVPILIAHVVEWDRHVAKTLITNEG